MTDYPAVLAALYPGAEWTLNANDPAQLVWRSDSPKPTQKELDAAWPQVESDRKWATVRAERDRLLTETDWTQVADTPVTDEERQAWADYRQALRDVPQTQTDPDGIVWPAR